MFYPKFPSILDAISLMSFLPLGEDIYIALYGAAVDYNVRLDKNTLKMENTFITSASQR